MTKQQVFISLIVSTILGALVGWAGSQYGQVEYGFPIFLICVGFAFIVNWLAFIPAYISQTEKFFDLTGSITYITATIIALMLSKDLDTRSMILAALVIIWATRLGTFLFTRIHRAGKDDRFDTIKPDFFRFLNTWTLQGLWVTFTASSALIAITTSKREEIGAFAIVGLIVWIIGFSIEVISDYQKSEFKKAPKNKGKFIQHGLWSKSRHPNYFGEIVLWIGVTIIAIPVLQGWQWIAFISPIFVTLLLTKISGVPMLEAKAEKKWGGQADYERYKSETPVLVPKF